MKRVCLLLLSLLLGVLLVVACGSSNTTTPTTTTPPTTTTTTPPTTMTTTPDVSAGADLLQQYCAVCHGAEREGIIGPTLMGLVLTDEEIETTISEGREGTAMPSWKDLLTAEEIGDLVAYLSEE